MPARAIVRRLVAVLVLVHVVALVVSGLPRSRFKESASAPVRGYLELTGQTQQWGMYQYLDRHRTEYELLAELPGGRIERPWGTAREMAARRLYFLEGLFLVPDRRELAHRFLDVLHARWKGAPAPSRLTLRRSSERIFDFQQLDHPPKDEPRRSKSEIVRAY
jgi:hypothetical protein